MKYRHNATLRPVRATIVVVKKAISITYSERRSVALGIQHAMRLLQTPSVACLAVLPHYS